MNKLILRRPFNRSMGLNVVVSVAIMVTCFVFPSLSKAQVSTWSTPQTIPGFDLSAFPPILIADQNRTVHAFSSQWISNEDSTSIKAIVYNQWTLYNGWTQPIDIMLSPIKETRLTDVYLDKNGVFHMTFFGGDNTGADIYYSKAPLAHVNDAHAWSTPIIIGKDAGDPAGAVFIEDDHGNFYVIFNGRIDGNGLYIVNSDNGGESWSNPAPIFFTLNDEPFISYLRVIKGKSGWFHAIWNVNNLAGQGRGIYYAKSQDGRAWGEPVLLAEATEDLGTQTPTIIGYKEMIVVIYNLFGKIRMQYSSDNGNAWSDRSIIFPRHGGVNGIPSLTIDSNDTLHILFGQRISGSPDIHGMWHSIFINDRWQEPEAVVKGPLVRDQDGTKGFDPYEAHATMSQGNILIVTWRSDPAAGNNGIWYSYKILDAPALPTVLLPTMPYEYDNNIPVNMTGTPQESTSTPFPTLFWSEQNNEMLSTSAAEQNIWKNPSFSIFIGFLMSLALLFVVFISRSIRKQ